MIILFHNGTALRDLTSPQNDPGQVLSPHLSLRTLERKKENPNQFTHPLPPEQANQSQH